MNFDLSKTHPSSFRLPRFFFMDIRQALMAEHSKRQTAAIVEYIGNDADRFAELMKLFFAGDYRLTQRAAWSMNYCAERHSQLIQPYLPRLLKLLQRDDQHDAIKRNIARLLQYIDVPKKLHAQVYSLCVELVDNPQEPAATRVFAMTAAARIAKKHPDLWSELQLIVASHLPHATAAFQSRAKTIL
ncbi:MAG: hypothetical protein JST84_13775 [Acidobacteria bacterium]|nr:hypothetical protein [Acidobacteriota bacterium]